MLPELGGERLPTRVFVSTYHDTPDLRLARHGVTFRHRVEDGAGLWQLKLPAGAARLELELAGTPAKPPAEMLVLLPAYLRGRELVPVARLRTRREGVRAQGAEIVDDNVSVLEGQRVARRFREVEVELLEGDERTLRRLEKELRRAGAETAGVLRPKLYRALGLAGPVEAVEIAPGTSPLEAIGLAIRAAVPGAARPRSRDPPGRRAGGPAPAAALRRAGCVRSPPRCAAVARRLLGTESLRAELGWLGGRLGPARDLDVLLEHLRAEVRALDGAAMRRTCRGCSTRSTPSAAPPTPMSSPRSRAIAT